MFKLKEHGTNVRREIVAGVTTFATMGYIIVVNPGVLQNAFEKVDQPAAFGAIMMATCIASAVATLLMGLWANYPIALAPAMGTNAFFAYTVCGAAAAGGMGIPWQQALCAVAISGTLFIIVSSIRLREHVVRAVPNGLRHAIAAGIGLMIALLGFEWAGLVVNHPVTLVTLGSLKNETALIALGGLTLTVILLVLRVKGAILLGIILTALVGYWRGAPSLGQTADASEIVGIPDISTTFLQLRLPAFDWAVWSKFLVVIFVFFFLDLFDTVGTLIGVSERGGLMKEGELPRAKQAFLSDAVATVVGAGLGTSTVTSYVESSAGIAAGGRTGLANVVTAGLFVVAIFFYPLVSTVSQVAVAPALIVVGAFMIVSLKHINWDDLTEAIPCFLTITMMAFAFSITEGISFGFISYCVVKLVTGRGREVSPVIYVLSVLFVIFYVFHPAM
ncbi:MAG TPA: NCS2 family permease [Planctomycetota bacterium]|nr:NCS2 family permease [Planctomycetota bacterium]